MLAVASDQYSETDVDNAAVSAANALIFIIEKAGPRVQSTIFQALRTVADEVGACRHCLDVSDRVCHCWNDE